MRGNYFLIQMGKDGVRINQYSNLSELSLDTEFFQGFSENRESWDQVDLCGKPLLIKGEHIIPKPKQVVQQWTE